MGSDKALLPFPGGNLLQLILGKAKQLSPHTVIVGPRDQYALYGDVLEDMVPGCGPLGGIHAALSATQTELNLLLSVDMPLMTVDFLRWLLQAAADSNDLAIVPETEGRLQPLCAGYRRGALPAIERELKAGNFKVDRIFSLVKTRRISETELCAAGFTPAIFCNVNTPADYEAAARQGLRIPLEAARVEGQ
jgi:molybdenum cofactor guanylyltransferase